uniref:Uncharacterized protein n=1 Tax=Monodelphis domestica TaxID=13616 RepID=A0A5F8GFX1_MONDO
MLDPDSARPTNITSARPYFSILQASFAALNYFNPNLTQSCWLCLIASPPCYEACSLNITYDITHKHPPPGFHWPPPGTKDPCFGITLSRVIGRGSFVAGKTSQPNPRVCPSITQPTTWEYLIPPVGVHWLCSSWGLQLCVSPTALGENQEYCIAVRIMPRVAYHSAQDLLRAWDQVQSHRQKREPFTIAATGATLLGATGAGMSVAALASQASGLAQLGRLVDGDIARLQQSLALLEKSHASLAEVALQNQRGLDLLFLKEGGLCAALGEECCFYVNHSGVIRNSLAKLQEDLEARKKGREAASPWFAQLFHSSPWLTTLISSLIGPLVLLVRILTFWPCILNRLVTFVKNRLNAIQVLLLRQQYQPLATAEPRLEIYGPTRV